MIRILVALSIEAFAIINGTNFDHGSMVALQMKEDDRYYKGSAVLIGRDTLLTAGHNVAYISNPKNVVAIFSSMPCWGENICSETRIAAIETRVHPKFRQIPGGTEYDVAVVKLAAPAPKSYQPMLLNESATMVGDRRVTAMGFGTDREEAAPLSAFRLRRISLRAVDMGYHLGSDQKFWLDQSDGGICGGDSGGPAIVNGLVAGIAIHVTYENGVSHCLTRGAFADVLFFREWIQGF